MPLKMDANSAQAWADEYNRKLRVWDFDPSWSVYMITDEGFACHWPSAFVIEGYSWYFIFAEHHSPQIHHEDEVIYIRQFVSKDILKVKDLEAFLETGRKKERAYKRRCRKAKG